MPNAIDQVTAIFSTRRDRRNLLKWSAAATGAAAVAGLSGLSPVAAQDGSPVAGDGLDDKVMYLFVQAFHNGNWEPGPEEGTYTLILHGGLASTIYFSDRPQRIFGAAPTDGFLDTLGFAADNPPNAALVVNNNGEADILVIELIDPVYDAVAQNLTYTAKVLEAYHETGLEYLAVQQADDSLPQEFGAGALFIDDCADKRGYCFLMDRFGVTWRSKDVYFGACWGYPNGCLICHDGAAQCNEWFPECKGECSASLY